MPNHLLNDLVWRKPVSAVHAFLALDDIFAGDSQSARYLGQGQRKGTNGGLRTLLRPSI